MRGQIHDGKRGAFLEAHPRGHLERLPRRQHHRVAVTAESRHAENAIADREPDDALADLIDRPRHPLADDAGNFPRIRLHAGARRELGEVDARRARANANLTGAGFGIGRLTHLEDLGRTGLANPNLAHGAHPSPTKTGGWGLIRRVMAAAWAKQVGI